MSFTFVTGNANKLREVQEILAAGGSGIQVTAEAVDVPEIQGTTQEVAIAKVKVAADKLGRACVTDDTALCFEAMDGLPGPYIKDFLGKLGHDGELLMDEETESDAPGLNTLLSGFPSKRATALCTLAYSAGPGAEPILFEGRTEGQIVPPRGSKNFGWDPIFEPLEGGGKTYDEMASEDKNKISHRYRAVEKLRLYLSEQQSA